LVAGRYVRLLPENTAVAAYLRQGEVVAGDANALLVLCNFTDQTQKVEGLDALAGADVSLVLGNLPEFAVPLVGQAALVLRPYEAVILRLL
jgi:Maltogenic Amylase, C-terminal domain